MCFEGPTEKEEGTSIPQFTFQPSSNLLYGIQVSLRAKAGKDENEELGRQNRPLSLTKNEKTRNLSTGNTGRRYMIQFWSNS